MRIAQQLPKLLMGISLCIATAIASAHSTEPVVKGPLTPKKALFLAERTADSLVRSEMLAKSWKQRKFKETKTRLAETKKLWVVAYANPLEKDETKKTLYIFLDDSGKYLDANHDGKLWGTAP
jgi:hypothetical protein